jgi:hypothetical protein
VASFESANSGPSAASYWIEIPNPETDGPKNKDKSETVKTAGTVREWTINYIHYDPKSDCHQRVTKQENARGRHHLRRLGPTVDHGACAAALRGFMRSVYQNAKASNSN